jgi:YgiT-type zinc finger domain-containing protein
MNCLLCKGELEKKSTTFMVDLGNCILIIKNVPSNVCHQCGEIYYSDNVLEQLEKIVDTMRSAIAEVAIINYAGKTA